MNAHEKINYVEFPTKDLEASKAFFSEVFGWTFEDFGEEYTAFSDEGLDGGFFKSEQVVSTQSGSALIVFYSESLESTQSKVE
ncbi:MAG: VOC family protein, partial [Cyanobacteria bacterium J06598_1]